MATDVLSAPEPEWLPVAARVRARREELNLTSTDAVARSGGRISYPTWSKIENPIGKGKDGVLPFGRLQIAGLCRALGWTPDSVERILAGDEPVELSRDENRDDAMRLVESLARQVEGFATRLAASEAFSRRLEVELHALAAEVRGRPNGL